MKGGQKYDVIIAGGGLAGLVAGILLSRRGFEVLLHEKKEFPFHKVCGEYVSNEILSLLKSIGFDPFDYGASDIKRLRMSDNRGRNIHSSLDLGGFGLSRFVMDHVLSRIAAEAGVRIEENSKVKGVVFDGEEFSVTTQSDTFRAAMVIGAYGKRDSLDKQLERKFIDRHTGYMGVKYHIRTEYPVDEIGIDHFPGGYCGIVRIEEDKYNLCYLYKRSGKHFQTIVQLEEEILFSNPNLRIIFSESEFLFREPLVINEISFDKKDCVSDHILFCGDTAGLITPLCGNGMAMAVHGAKVLSDLIVRNLRPGENLSAGNRIAIETGYERTWKKLFSFRLFAGRQLQRLAENPSLTTAALKLMNNFPAIRNVMIRSTHGKPVDPVTIQSARQLHQTSHQ